MPEISMAAGTMDDVYLAPGQQHGVAFRKVVDMYCQQVLAQGAAAFQVLNRRAQTAVGHIALVSAQPIEHLALAAHEHIELLGGFGDVDGDGPVAAAGQAGAQSQ